MVGMRGFEPRASCSRSKRSTRLSYIPTRSGADDVLQVFRKVARGIYLYGIEGFYAVNQP